jgi:hypothetical protein
MITMKTIEDKKQAYTNNSKSSLSTTNKSNFLNTMSMSSPSKNHSIAEVLTFKENRRNEIFRKTMSLKEIQEESEGSKQESKKNINSMKSSKNTLNEPKSPQVHFYFKF